MIHIVREPATERQIREMLRAIKAYIKVVVDVKRGILAGGSEWHYQCEEILLEDGSQQSDLWGADWDVETQSISYESMVNIRPQDGNRSMIVQSPALRSQIAEIVQRLLGEQN